MLPEKFLDRMQQMLGSEYASFVASFEQERYQALRLNTLKKDSKGQTPVDTFGMDGCFDKKSVQTCFAHLTPVPWAENGFYYEAADRPGKHPYHEAGLYYIQEPSAMAPVELLEVKPGERVLDLCAAPGGKSTQIAAKLRGKGFLLCNEIHPARAKILSENVERMGIRSACVTNETPVHLANKFPGYFDKVLVDAPCSGEGMFRKNEDACGEWSPENVKLCGERQDEILENALSMLRPGGRLVYSTCTFAPTENEGSIDRLLKRHPEVKIVPIDKTAFGGAACDGVPEYIGSDNIELKQTLRLWPQHIKGEGHYAAVLVKDGEWDEENETMAIGGVEKGLNLKDDAVKAYLTFSAETLQSKTMKELKGNFLRFGDNLYLAPDCMPALKGLKVMRPGLHLGELKKNRFEPSHALALALSPSEVKHVSSLSLSDMTVASYLNGQTFPAEGEKGWYLICVDGFSLGWGKLAGGIMKNHYPKGLRKV